MTSFIIIFSCLAAIASANPYLKKPYAIKHALKECKHDLDIDVPKGEKKLSISGPLNLPIFDPKYACLNKCTLEKAGLLSTTGAFNITSIPKVFEPIGKQCDEITKNLTNCERAHNLTICLVEKTREMLNETVISCANQTETQLNVEKTYKLKDFLKEKKYYCMNRCVLIKLNAVDESNDVKVDMVKEFAPPNANIPEIIEECSEDNKSSNQCKMVAKRQRCIIKKIKKLD